MLNIGRYSFTITMSQHLSNPVAVLKPITSPQATATVFRDSVDQFYKITSLYQFLHISLNYFCMFQCGQNLPVWCCSIDFWRNEKRQFMENYCVCSPLSHASAQFYPRWMMDRSDASGEWSLSSEGMFLIMLI